MDVLPFEAPADAAYGMIRARLEKAGRPIGGNDLLIAAQAIALGYILVTDNRKSSPASRISLARIGYGRDDDAVTVSR
jgi:predicted nucleic acid-binding protein